MNMSRAISSLKLSLGLNMITLPFQDENGKPVPTENVIKEVIQTITIPEYSQFSPWMRKGDIEWEMLKPIDKINGIYLLPQVLTITPIMYVADVSMPMHNNRGTYGDVAPAYGINRSVEGVLTSQAYMMIAGQMRAEPTFEYLGHNKIKLYGFPRTKLTFTVACEHDPSGETIEDSCYDSFMELATLDMKVFLYNNLKLYDQLPSAFGNVQLKVEDYNGASGERDQLLEKWRDNFHLDMDIFEWM